MHISDAEITRRMDLLDLNRDALELLASHKIIFEDNIDEIVEEFYQKQIEIDEISLLIGDADSLRRLHTAQRKYVLDLFSGHYDSEYVNNRLRIGMVHKRIGVKPALYLSAVRTLKEILFRILGNNVDNEDELKASLSSLDKLLYFDITLVFDTYIDSLVSEIESEKKKTEDYAKGLEEKIAERTKQLEEQAKRDPLTKIYNQRAMQEFLRRELIIARRRQTVLSLIYFDIDNFKSINDTDGHIKGDEVLKSIGRIIIKSIRETDIACRYGGDEFCLILPECRSDKAKEVCEKIIKKFSKKYQDYSLSIGIAETNSDHNIDGDQLIRVADEKMYLAKKEQGSTIQD